VGGGEQVGKVLHRGEDSMTVVRDFTLHGLVACTRQRGRLLDDGLLYYLGLLPEEVGGMLVVGQRLTHGHQLGGGVLADQPHSAVLLGAPPVGHQVQLPVQVIPEAMGVRSVLAGPGGDENFQLEDIC